MKTKKALFALSAIAVIFLGGCKSYPDYSNDFRFPIAAGDIARGEQAFVDLGCHQCHVVNGVQLPEFSGSRPLTVDLGGELIFAKTYGDLATSIINPDHVISERYLEQLSREEQRALTSSPMYLKEDMKVTQLIDIVAFLNSRYSFLPGYTEYYY